MVHTRHGIKHVAAPVAWTAQDDQLTNKAIETGKFTAELTGQLGHDDVYTTQSVKSQTQKLRMPLLKAAKRATDLWTLMLPW